MAIVIAQPCIKTKDTACVAECPVDALHPTREEADFEKVEQLYIDPGECICCNLCVSACPVGAIFDEDDLPEDWKHFTQLNADYFQKK